MLVVFELNEDAPQRTVDLEDFRNALPLGVHLRSGDVQREENERDRARDEDPVEPKGSERAGPDLHCCSFATISLT